MQTAQVETILRVFLSLFAGAAMLAAFGAGVFFGVKPLFKAMLPQVDLQRELLQGNRAVALFTSLVFSAVLIAAALLLAAIYNRVLR